MKKTTTKTFELSAEVALGLLIAVFAFALVYRHFNKPAVVTQNCYEKLAELDTVAHIATATGRLPGEPKTAKPGTKFAVKTNYCAGK